MFFFLLINYLALKGPPEAESSTLKQGWTIQSQCDSKLIWRDNFRLPLLLLAIWSEKGIKQISQARCFSLQSQGGYYSRPCYLKGVCKLILG